MRAYQLHTSSWSRIVDARVRTPEAMTERLATRRRPAQMVPADGQLVLLRCNHRTDPRSGERVDRRELLDRVIEALSVADVDGVIASASLLEELALLNVLEHRLAFCATGSEKGGLPTSVTNGHFDGAFLTRPLHDASHTVETAASTLAGYGLPVILNLSLEGSERGAEFDTVGAEWIDPLLAATSRVMTGAGLWLTVPAVYGFSEIVETTGFPVLMRDTDVPIQASAWANFFDSDLPVTIRGLLPGVSALFPIEGSVAEATATIAGAVRGRPGRSASV